MWTDQVDPLALNGLEILKVLAQISKFCFPERRFVLKVDIVRRVFERLQKALIVSNLHTSQ